MVALYAKDVDWMLVLKHTLVALAAVVIVGKGFTITEAVPEIVFVHMGVVWYSTLVRL